MQTPIIDGFVGASGPSVYMKMTNFSAAEFGFLWTSDGIFCSRQLEQRQSKQILTSCVPWLEIVRAI